jgi:CTP:molybdopterin cytidylyltransferase MocA
VDQLPAAVVILAAGAGTRMKSALPKVLHSVAGRTLLGHAIAAGRQVNPSRLCVVVRHERDRVAADALGFDDSVLIADQDETPGTGRAVQCALDRLAADGADLGGPIIVTAADTPMLDGGILAELMRCHVDDGNAVTVLTTHLANPTGYGRIVRERGAVVGIVSRLDAPVTGVVLLARTSKAARRLTEQFRSREVEKTYWAVVEGLASPIGTLVDWLVHDERHRRMHVAAPETPGAKEARLSYRRLQALAGRSLLEVQLDTGRKHQIRLQLAHHGHPIVGDRKYGSREAFPAGIALHARRLAFTHPVKNDRLELIAPLPASWNRFGISAP